MKKIIAICAFAIIALACSSKKEGKGLGLSIVASGLEEMGAVISVSSNYGLTNFCMNFPLKKS